jgi:hypothetical protein
MKPCELWSHGKISRRKNSGNRGAGLFTGSPGYFLDGTSWEAIELSSFEFRNGSVPAASIFTIIFRPASSISSCSDRRTNCSGLRPRILAKRAARSAPTTLQPFSISQRCEGETPSLRAKPVWDISSPRRIDSMSPPRVKGLPATRPDISLCCFSF